MNLNNVIDRINGPYILYLIREEKAKSIYDLKKCLIPPEISNQCSLAVTSRIGAHIHSIVRQLADAGLIGITNQSLTPTPLIEKIQVALNISLTTLSKHTLNSMLVNPLFGQTETVSSMPNVFVLMSFANNLQPVYDDHIKKVCAQLNFSVARADDFFAANSVISDIWKAIVNCRITIADCTERNPNIFYEIGIAHTIGRPTILITQNKEDVPFDLRHIRYIHYSYTPKGMTTFEKSLYKTLEAEKAKFPTNDI